MNSGYGSDWMNQEKYSQTKLLSSDRPWLSHFKANALDMNRMHYICGDTDSMTWTICGNPDAEEGYRQKFKNVIKDQKFYNKNYPLFFGQYIQLLGVSYEEE
ncbi:MAG: hypothetical protein EZS28_002260 [Streblomastix strix]|uniref:Uncharacterized protein n=1 Tax=Streblomastix strix TaxID=222440 RepID=A0A5J4X4I6_9EUKA|nr:MAG: hypothetical protein EZS28_002260 [Streblomastix strix]